MSSEESIEILYTFTTLDGIVQPDLAQNIFLAKMKQQIHPSTFQKIQQVNLFFPGNEN